MGFSFSGNHNLVLLSSVITCHKIWIITICVTPVSRRCHWWSRNCYPSTAPELSLVLVGFVLLNLLVSVESLLWTHCLLWKDSLNNDGIHSTNIKKRTTTSVFLLVILLSVVRFTVSDYPLWYLQILCYVKQTQTQVKISNVINAKEDE